MEQGERTRKALIDHYQRYPKLQIQDVFKFLYQSAFGCEHFVASTDAATRMIEEEYSRLCIKDDPIETLDGAYSRVPVSYLNRGLRAETFGKLFAASAESKPDGRIRLLEKINVAKQLVLERVLPFSEKEFDRAVKEWKEKGYPAVHHSELFRKSYCPHYRVIANRFIPFLPLLAELDQRPARGKVTVALEGGSACEKTTFCKLLEKLYDCTVLHMDDFFPEADRENANLICFFASDAASNISGQSIRIDGCRKKL